jgi:hypothetical protein
MHTKPNKLNEEEEREREAERQETRARRGEVGDQPTTCARPGKDCRPARKPLVGEEPQASVASLKWRMREEQVSLGTHTHAYDTEKAKTY